MKSRATHQGTGLSRGTGDTLTPIGVYSAYDRFDAFSNFNPLSASSSPLNVRQGGLYSSQNAPLPTSFIDLADLAHRKNSFGSVLSQEHETTGGTHDVGKATQELGQITHDKKEVASV